MRLTSTGVIGCEANEIPPTYFSDENRHHTKLINQNRRNFGAVSDSSAALASDPTLPKRPGVAPDVDPEAPHPPPYSCRLTIELRCLC